MKAIKQGNSIVLTVPTKFNIEPNQEFVAIKGEMGSITYVPKVENIFKEALDKDEYLRFEDEFEEGTELVGKED